MSTNKDKFLMHFSGRLKKSRQEAKPWDGVSWTQDVLAKKVGVSRLTIGRYERGDISPTAEVLSIICSYLNIDANWLLTGFYVDKAGDAPKPDYEKPSDTMPTIMDALAELELSLDAQQLQAAMNFAFVYRADKQKIVDFMVWGHQVAGVPLEHKVLNK
jgi:transcriptional regulator with XRE-family HTH domain